MSNRPYNALIKEGEVDALFFGIDRASLEDGWPIAGEFQLPTNEDLDISGEDAIFACSRDAADRMLAHPNNILIGEELYHVVRGENDLSGFVVFMKLHRGGT